MRKLMMLYIPFDHLNWKSYLMEEVTNTYVCVDVYTVWTPEMKIMFMEELLIWKSYLMEEVVNAYNWSTFIQTSVLCGCWLMLLRSPLLNEVMKHFTPHFMYTKHVRHLFDSPSSMVHWIQMRVSRLTTSVSWRSWCLCSRARSWRSRCKVWALQATGEPLCKVCRSAHFT